tara:strand:- start:5506 stop:7188 length:1683 start_codon:yes stop_codon:yes gene_type:complete
MAAQQSGTERQQLELMAATRYLDANNIAKAQPILTALANSALPPELFVSHQLLQAKIYINLHQPQSALRLLSRLNTSQNTTSLEQQEEQLQLLAKAYQQNHNLVASIQTRTQLLNQESSDDRKNTLTAIWLSLQTVPASTIETLNDPSLPRNIQGWFELSQIINNHAPQTSINAALVNWQQRFPNHPATDLLPKSLNRSQASTPQHIALLLPLTGEYAGNAQAIRNGFFTAYYYAKQHTTNTPSIRLIDTTSTPISTAYREAVKSGADFIVGPLTKTNLANLTESQRISVPTLALNTLANSRRIDNLYQFGLSPLDETNQLAKKAQQTQHHRALIIAPNDSWGQNIATQLSKQWRQQQGVVVDRLNYTTRNKLSQELKQLLRIQDSYSRGYAIRSILGTKDVRIISRRRQDFDSIFLIAQPNMARQIQPLLQFYFAGDIPIYALSQLYDGSPNPTKDRDLNSIVFCDMPWVLEPQKMHPTYLNTLQKQSQNVWPKSYQKYSKLYALGTDAYRLSQSLNTMQLLPEFGIRAATGTLYLDDNHIYRQLMWAQFNQGKPRLTH